jgi:hypothetical protein
METESEQTFADFVPFAALYAPAIPSQRVGDFFIRKIAFEKDPSHPRKEMGWISGDTSKFRDLFSAEKSSSK